MRLTAFSVLAAGFALTSCSSLDTRPNQGPCPSIASLYEVSRIVEFDGPENVFGNIAYTGEIVDVRLYCRYVDNDPIEAEIEIDFAFGRGDKGDANKHNYRYFVAATRTNRAVMAKETYTVQADFGRDGVLDETTEKVARISIPRKDSTISGVNFEILVGFELTDEQLAYNRGGNRFRLDAGE